MHSDSQPHNKYSHAHDHFICLCDTIITMTGSKRTSASGATCKLTAILIFLAFIPLAFLGATLLFGFSVAALAVTAVVCLLLGGFAIFLIRKKLLHLVKQLSSILSKGDFSKEMAVNSSDEIGDLSLSYNELAKEIRAGQQVIEAPPERMALAAEVPDILGDSAGLRILVQDRALWGRKDAFLRIDLYPRVRPIPRERHFGYWDLPLECVRQECTDVVLDLTRRALVPMDRAQTDPPGPLGGERFRFFEPGNALLHLSLWDHAPSAPRMVKAQSYPLQIAQGWTPGMALDSPLKQIHIPVTDDCNLACPMCPRNSGRLTPTGSMAAGVFEALLEEVPFVQCVMVMALGEPLLYPSVVEVVRRCRKRLPTKGEVGMTTNATLLDPGMAGQLRDAGLGFLYASVDGATAATYERIRVGARFDAVCANIQSFAGLAREKSIPCRIMMNFVMLEENLHEIPAFVRLAVRLGVANVTLSYVHGRHTDELNTFAQKRLEALLCEAKRIGREFRVNVGIPPVRRLAAERCFCTERVLTSPDGGVYPCPMLQPGYNPGGTVMRFGNVLERPLREIWASESYRAFRTAVLAGQFPDACDRCGFKAFHTP